VSDPRLHGPAACPVAPAGCEACHGEHHWLEHGFNPEDEDYCTPENLTDQERAVLAHDKEYGTLHHLGYYGCKHCSSWCECEYVWEVLEGEEEEKP
jgi:hypothetical protein